MGELILQIIIGIVIIILGIFNMNGNIKLLHSYHTKRIKKEDILPFGKRVGIGSIIIGLTVIISAVLTYLEYINICNIVLIIGFIIGLIIIFHALFKYNKGIF